jgi:hypothetical protein
LLQPCQRTRVGIQSGGTRLDAYAAKRLTTLVKTWLYQDKLRPVAELDDAGNLRARFVYAGARKVPDYMIAYATDTTLRTVWHHGTAMAAVLPRSRLVLVGSTWTTT